MKILHVYKTFLGDNFGGVEQVIAQIASNHQNPEFEHSVISLSKNPVPMQVDYPGFKNYRYKENFNLASNGMSFSLMKDFSSLTQKADIIHYHFPWPFADLLHLIWRIKKPSIVTYHSDIIRQKNLLRVYAPLMNRFLNSVNKIVATSPHYFNSSPVLQKYKEKVAVVPIGLNKQSYLEPDVTREKYWQQKLPEKFFLFVGVLRYYKGLHILLDALKNATFPVVIVGQGPMEESLKKQAEELNLKHVYFLGRLSDEDKIILLKQCYALIFPSHLRSEAFGVSLLEAAMYAKPMISCDVGTGSSYVNLHQSTGLVVPPDSPEALFEAMLWLFNNDSEAVKMGKAAEDRFNQFFQAEHMVNAYEALYKEIALSP
ncbi:MAG: glycosyltransferase [Proteobacteria bacterium]|nr:glycosyltransferase [Pseudomonadota bacterium]